MSTVPIAWLIKYYGIKEGLHSTLYLDNNLSGYNSVIPWAHVKPVHPFVEDFMLFSGGLSVLFYHHSLTFMSNKFIQ